MGFFDAVKKGVKSAKKTVAGNKALKTIAIAGAVNAGTALGGPVGGIVAGKIASSQLSDGKGKASKQKKAKAVRSASSSGGSTAHALAESTPGTAQGMAPGSGKKGFLAMLLGLFG